MITVIDGGLSTALAELGADTSSSWWTADALRTSPHVLEAAHRSFVVAGARVVTSASYQCPSHEHDALRASTAIARRAAGDDARVAASIGPFGAWLADGSEYNGAYDVSLEVVRSRHTERIRVLLDTDVDLFAVETQPRADEAEMIAEILVDHGAPPAWFSFGCRDGSTTYGGGSTSRRVPEPGRGRGELRFTRRGRLGRGHARSTRSPGDCVSEPRTSVGRVNAFVDGRSIRSRRRIASPSLGNGRGHDGGRMLRSRADRTGPTRARVRCTRLTLVVTAERSVRV
jgi:hypothetical protein